jgi:hypothetical protein
MAEERHRGVPVLVYQMGKVGSTAVYRALRSLPADYSVYHVHTLNRNLVRAAHSAYRATYRTRRIVPHHLFASERLLDELKAEQPRGRWKVITIIRDPIARNISSFFQDIELRHPSWGFSKRLRQQSTSELVDDLVELFMSSHDHSEPLRWCERELGGVLGTDVYATPFPTNLGWERYDSDVAQVVLVRLENLGVAWPECVSRLFDRALPALPAANLASEKSYAELYRSFKQRLKLPLSYIEDMYGSPFAQHFYTAAERDRFALRWTASVPR